LIGPAPRDACWAAIVGGAESELSAFPFVRLDTFPVDRSDAKALKRTVARVLDQRPSAVVLWIYDDSEFELGRQIAAQGPALVTVGLKLPGSSAFGYVDTGQAAAAGLLGRNLKKIAGRRRSYVLLHGNGASELATRKYLRFSDEARRRVLPVLLADRTTAGTATNERALVREMLDQFKHAGLVVTLDAEIWLEPDWRGVLSGGAQFATTSASPLLWDALREGRAAAVAGVLDGETGATATRLALQAIMENIDAARIRTLIPELVTSDTLDNFSLRYAEAAGMTVGELRERAASSEPFRTTRPGG